MISDSRRPTLCVGSERIASPAVRSKTRRRTVVSEARWRLSIDAVRGSSGRLSHYMDVSKTPGVPSAITGPCSGDLAGGLFWLGWVGVWGVGLGVFGWGGGGGLGRIRFCSQGPLEEVKEGALFVYTKAPGLSGLCPGIDLRALVRALQARLLVRSLSVWMWGSHSGLRDGLSHRMIRLKPDRGRERPPHNFLNVSSEIDNAIPHTPAED